MAGFIQLNTPTTKPQTNGIRIFIFSLCLLIGLIRKNWPKHGTKLHTILTLWTFAEFAKPKLRGYSKAVAEVCKYALKFSDLSTENTWHAFLSLKGKRLTGSFGSMHGVKIPDTATPDDKPSEELPYMEMLYRFVFGKKSYYDLQITKDVKPHG